MITKNFLSLNMSCSMQSSGGPAFETTHAIIEEPYRISVKYKNLDNDPVTFHSRTFNLAEVCTVGAHKELHSNIPSITPVATGSRGEELKPLYYPLHGFSTQNNPNHKFFDLVSLHEIGTLSIKHTEHIPPIKIDNTQYPYYLIWPENEEKAFFETEETIYAAYVNDHLVNYTPQETRLDVMKYVYTRLLTEMRNIIAFSNDDNEREACHIYLSFLHNTALWMFKEENRLNNAIWEDFLHIPDIDTFFDKFNVSQSNNEDNQTLKLDMLNHKRVYGYDNGSFYIRRSSIAGENPDTIPDNTPELGAAADHANVREMMNLHPLARYQESRLNNIKLITNPNINIPYSPAFAPDTLEYNTVTINRDSRVWAQVEKKVPEQTFVIGGDSTTPNEHNVVTLTCTSADGQHATTYTFNIETVAD